MDTKKISVDCVISGGGPAGMFLGLLLAKAGIKTLVLEKWPDFFRDFRGDTIHPSTMEILYELGLLEKFLSLPHNKTYKMEGEIGENRVIIADFSHLKVHCPFIAFIPQWDFLNFIAKEAQSFSNFELLMNTKAEELIEDEGKIIGLKAKRNDIFFEIYADLIVAADGRHSIIREKSGLATKSLGSPMDVLWFRLSKKSSDKNQSLGKIDFGKLMIMLDRGDYWQCGFLIRKGEFDKLKEQGLSAFYKNLIELAPLMADRLDEITSFDDIKFLEVIVNRMEKWYKPGLIFIGDAAHAMSPIGGVGINLAIQDAVASANILIPAFLQDNVTESHLKAIQQRRELPTKIIQSIQVFIQDNIINRVLGNEVRAKLPRIIKLTQIFPSLQRIPGFMIGLGIRREHIRYLRPLGSKK